jgi:hypothetical protein
VHLGTQGNLSLWPGDQRGMDRARREDNEQYGRVLSCALTACTVVGTLVMSQVADTSMGVLRSISGYYSFVGLELRDRRGPGAKGIDRFSC